MKNCFLCADVLIISYTVHLLIGELHYAALTLTPDGPVAASRQASSSQIFLNRLRCVYRELPILIDLPCEMGDLPVIDVSLPLKRILVRKTEEKECQILEIYLPTKTNHDQKNKPFFIVQCLQNEFNYPEIEVVSQMKGNLVEIRRVLMENVQKLIDQGQRLEDLVQKTQVLEITVIFLKLKKSIEKRFFFIDIRPFLPLHCREKITCRVFSNFRHGEIFNDLKKFYEKRRTS